jgi:isopenicillin-N epimerase
VDLTRPASPIDRWALDPTIVHLNHGSYGGCPRAVIDAATAFRSRLEAAPMRFFILEWQAELDRARAAVAAFVRADPARMVFVPSATSGVAIALHAADLAAGDEIVTTSHIYPACRHQLTRLAEARGVRLAIAETPLPFDADALVDRVTAAITPRTKLALLDHITSATALVYPIERLIAPFAARGIPVIVDGAHAPGQIPLDVSALGATWYVGNHHKWMCGPKASAFLVSAGAVRPLVTSHGANPQYGPPNRMHAELDWSGTYDPTSQLAVPAAIETLGAEGGGWPQVYARNHALALALRDRVGRGIAPDDAIGTMAVVPITLPVGVTPQALERTLLTDGWEVPIVDFPGHTFARVSAHLYNHVGEAEAFARKLHALGVRA